MDKNVYDYNKVFRSLDEDCKTQNICNAFHNITYADLMELNDLLDKVILFCDNISEEELEEVEGYDILKLSKLVDQLFTKDMNIKE